ncbi:GapA-binding peptide SR1P [Mesobacillus foraminis]|nr:GapA-binding peptide SR1P [Mesobacillus foraminis]
MGTVICSDCNRTVDHFEDEKITVLYSRCNSCLERNNNTSH